jgi:glucan phosphoethanolaminetransferase (alkaline phosphatase superfamily)
MDWLNDLWNQISQIFSSADTTTLIIIALAVLAVGFMTESLASIVTMTFVGLVIFAVLQYARGVLLDKQDINTLAQTDWHNLMALQVQVLLAYAIAFAVLIGAVSLVRSLVFR